MSETNDKHLRYRRLYRSRRERILGGVCGGLAEYLGASPVVMRLIWIVLAFIWGVGIIAYILALVVAPLEKETSGQKSQSAGRRAGLLIGMFLIVVGLIALLENLLWHPIWLWEPLKTSIFPAILTVIGLILLFVRLRPAAVYKSEVCSCEHPGADEARLSSAPPIQPAAGLRRSRAEKVLCGLCGGIGCHFHIDPTLVRLGWATGTLLTKGFGILVYFFMVLLVPKEPERPRDASKFG